MKKTDVAVRLRMFTEEDIPRKIAWAHDPRINRFLHHDLPLTEEKVRVWLEQMAADDRHDLVIETLAGDAIGTIGLENVDRQHRRGEYYICIGDPAYHGTSASSNAVHILLGYAFLQLGLYKVYGVTETGNIGSMALMAQLGFQHEGNLRQEYLTATGPRDGLRMCLLAADYLARRDREASGASDTGALGLYEQVIEDVSRPDPAFFPPPARDAPPDLAERLRRRPDLGEVLQTLEVAGRERRDGECGEVPIEPRADDSWLELLRLLGSLSRLPAEPGRVLDLARDVSRATAASHRLAPLTPALWQAVYAVLWASLAALHAGYGDDRG